MTLLTLVAVLVVGCAGAPSPTPTLGPAGEEVNFRLLISDEVNAIEDFEQFYVTISSIGVHQAGESSEWITHELVEPKTVDLTELTGDNATEIWSGYVDPGEYNKVFIYADNVTGIPKADVKLPSNKLQISKPFTLSTDLIVSFVFDITVVEAGKSSQYILLPQIGQSGADQPFSLVTPKGRAEKLGKPEKPRKPQDKGKPEEQAEVLEFEGTIEHIQGTIWTMTIDGEARTVDVGAAEIEGEPVVGLEAKVKGTVVDGTIVASEVEIRGTEGGGS